MRKSRRAADQILAILRETELAPDPSDVLRRYGVSRRTYYRWKARFREPILRDVALLSRLREENVRLRAVVAEQAMRLHGLEQMVAGHRRPPVRRVRRPPRRSMQA